MPTGKFQVETEVFEFSTLGEIDIIDLSNDVSKFVHKTGITEGRVTVFVSGSTGAVGFTECEPLLTQDNKRILGELIPKGAGYRHDEIDNNAHSHLRTTLIGSDVSIPVTKGQLVLGTWQQLVFFELDVHPRHRRIVFQIMGI